jgi:hypothetical protein
MAHMNWSRILFGGLLAGAVINASEFLLHQVVLRAAWALARQQFKEPPASSDSAQFAVFTVAGFVAGILIAWLYAAMRPRFGAGPRTSLRAALAVWLPGYALAFLAPLTTGFLPGAVALPAMAAGLVELMVAGLLAGWVYREANGEAVAVVSQAEPSHAHRGEGT